MFFIAFSWSGFFTITAIVMVSLAVILLFGAFFYNRSWLIRSEYKVSDTPLIETDQFYYLPTALLKIKAVARVAIFKNDQELITSARVTKQSFEVITQIVPDTRYLITLKYNSSVFSNDDIKFTTSAQGLLNGINAVAEDKGPAIITQLLQVNQALSGEASKAVSKAVDTARLLDQQASEYIEFTKEFSFSLDEALAKDVPVSWDIHVEGYDQLVPASFIFNLEETNSTPASSIKPMDPLLVDGIVVRPCKNYIFRCSQISSTLEMTVSQGNAVSLPDPNALVWVPIKRSAFVKKTYAFKFENGMLVENNIIKPSESEGFISVPVNILKAIFSIPSQLFTFTIRKKYSDTIQELEMQKKVRELEKDMAGYTFTAEKNKYDLEESKFKLEKAKADFEKMKTDLTTLKADNKKLKEEVENLRPPGQ